MIFPRMPPPTRTRLQPEKQTLPTEPPFANSIPSFFFSLSFASGSLCAEDKPAGRRAPCGAPLCDIPAGFPSPVLPSTGVRSWRDVVESICSSLCNAPKPSQPTRCEQGPQGASTPRGLPVVNSSARLLSRAMSEHSSPNCYGVYHNSVTSRNSSCFWHSASTSSSSRSVLGNRQPRSSTERILPPRTA